jgi:hypothetical protein
MNTKQDQVITLLLSGKNQKEAAAEVGVREETISRWVNSDARFVSEFRARRLELWESSAQRLHFLTNKAIGVVEELLESPNEAIRLRAAGLVLKAVSLFELDPPPARDITPESVERTWELGQQIRLLSGLIQQKEGKFTF